MPNKSLGQHWLKDRSLLEAIADSLPLRAVDTVVEIGPGQGTLTSVLLARAGKVIAVEYDPELARKLPGQFPGKKLEVIPGDILSYDLSTLPVDYTVVANIPYYITTKIITRLIRSENPPVAMALLMQQEVAEKLAAQGRKLTPLAVELQLGYNVQLGTPVQKQYFTPPPKVDSQVLICKKRQLDKEAQKRHKDTMRLVVAGFSQPRKKLRTSLAAGLAIETVVVENWLQAARIGRDVRAQEVSLDEWQRLSEQESSSRSNQC